MGQPRQRDLAQSEVLAVFQTLWATERFNVTARGAAGVRWGPYVETMFYEPHRAAVIEAAVAFTVAILGPVGFVGESEVLVDRVPMTTRLLLRADLPIGRGWLALDVGVQLSVVEALNARDMLDQPMTFQPIAQVRWYPVLDWPWPGTHPDSGR